MGIELEKQREFDELLTYAQKREDERLQALELVRLIDDLEIPQCVEEARILKRPDRAWEYVDAEQLRQHINRKREGLRAKYLGTTRK